MILLKWWNNSSLLKKARGNYKTKNGWVKIGVYDTEIDAINFARNNEQYTKKSGLLKCNHHRDCPSHRRCGLEEGKWVVQQTSAEHGTELMVYNEGFPRILRDIVDTHLRANVKPLKLCNKLDQTFKQPGFEEHRAAFQKLLLSPEVGEFRKVNQMIKSRSAYLNKTGSGSADPLIYRATLDDFLMEHKVLI